MLRSLPIHISIKVSWLSILSSAGLIIAAISILGFLLYIFGPLSFAIVIFVLIIFPWLIQDLFRIFLWLLITWPILSLFLRFPLPAGIPDLSYDRVLLLTLLLLIGVKALHSKKSRIKFTTLEVLLIIYIITQLIMRIHVIVFGGLGNTDLNGFLDVILIPAIIFWMVKKFLISETHLKWLLVTIVIACLIICLTGLYEQAVGIRVFKSNINLGGTEVVYQWIDSQGRLRAAGAMGNPAVYGAIMGMGILAGAGYLPQAKHKITKAGILATMVVLLYGVFASYTRSAWVSVFVVLFFAQFFFNGLWKKTLPIILLTFLVLVVMWNDLPGSSAIIDRALTTKTIDQRVEIFKIGLEYFREKPILGWGSGSLNIFNMARAGITSHNTYLTFLVDGGIILLLSFIAAMGYLLIRAAQLYRTIHNHHLERNILVAMTGSIVIYLLSGMALELRYFGYFNTLVWICAGVIDLLITKYLIEGKSIS